MYFIINGYDYTDEGSLKRRLAAREEHMDNVKRMVDNGEILMAAAMTNKDDNMCGSTLFLKMDSREAVDLYLEKEAYVIQKVWEKVHVTPCKIPPMFLNK